MRDRPSSDATALKLAMRKRDPHVAFICRADPADSNGKGAAQRGARTSHWAMFMGRCGAWAAASFFGPLGPDTVESRTRRQEHAGAREQTAGAYKGGDASDRAARPTAAATAHRGHVTKLIGISEKLPIQDHEAARHRAVRAIPQGATISGPVCCMTLSQPLPEAVAGRCSMRSKPVQK